MTTEVHEKRAILERNKQLTRAVVWLQGRTRRQQALNKLLGEVLNDGNVDTFRTALMNFDQSQSQFRQDFFALAFSGFKSDGFFVEFGACDGVHLSNSWFLEKYMGWQGILSEPARVWHDALKKNRTATIDTRCVWKNSGEKLPFREEEAPGQSKLVLEKDETSSKDHYEVETITLNALLDELQAPNRIDFLSMDTEGTEADILNSFDFTKYQFGFICIEDHGLTSTIPNLLSDNGYQMIFARDKDRNHVSQISGFDSWFVPKNTASIFSDLVES